MKNSTAAKEYKTIVDFLYKSLLEILIEIETEKISLLNEFFNINMKFQNSFCFYKSPIERDSSAKQVIEENYLKAINFSLEFFEQLKNILVRNFILL